MKFPCIVVVLSETLNSRHARAVHSRIGYVSYQCGKKTLLRDLAASTIHSVIWAHNLLEY